MAGHARYTALLDACVLYPVAMTAASKTAATAKFVDFIRSPAKAVIFERQGFVVVK